MKVSSRDTSAVSPGESELQLPIDLICVPDYPNTCPDDGARTELIQQLSGRCVEKCLQCGETYLFWDDETSSY